MIEENKSWKFQRKLTEVEKVNIFEDEFQNSLKRKSNILRKFQEKKFVMVQTSITILGHHN